MKNAFFSLCLLALSLGAAEPFVLVKNGRAQAVIFAASDAVPSIHYAAQELARAVELCTGAKLKIVHELPSGAAVVLTTGKLPAALRADGEKVRKSGTDGYAWGADGNKLYIYGANGKGVLNGVYRLLRKNAPIVYVRPMLQDGIATHADDLAIAGQGADIPDYALRTLSLYLTPEEPIHRHMARLQIIPSQVRPRTVPESAEGQWQIKFGNMATYYDVYSIAHNMVSWWLPLKRYAEKHPEYYMLVDGKRILQRNTHPCIGNPAVLAEYKRRLHEELPKLPKRYGEFGLMIEDTNLVCECPLCNAPLKLPDGSTLTREDPAYLSTFYMMFFNELARETAKINPALKMRVYGYYFLAEPPKVRIEPNLRINWCPYPRDMKQSLFFGENNRRWRERFDGYIASSGDVILREYYYCGALFPRPLIDVAAQDLRYAHEKGVKQFYSDFHGTDKDQKKKKGKSAFSSAAHWDLCAQEYWVLGELLWDLSRDPAELRHEFLRRAYPGGSAGMIRFFDLIGKEWLSSKASSSFNDDAVRSTARYIVNAKIEEPCRKALADALKTETHPVSKKLIQRTSAVFEKLVKLAKEQKALECHVPETPKGKGIDWEKAPRITPFTKLGNLTVSGETQIDARVGCDSRNWYFRIDIRKKRPGIFTVVKPGTPGERFPSGDHVELSFEDSKAGFTHFAMDANGTRWEALGGSASWNGAWSGKAEKHDTFWRAEICIPFETVGFVPLQTNVIRAMVMVSARDGNNWKENLPWYGCRPMAPDTWNLLVMKLL